MPVRLAILLVLLLAPAGLAQMQVLEDAADDPTATLAGMAVPGVDTAPYDLLGLWVTERADEFLFTVQVADIDPPSQAADDVGTIDIDFTHNDQGYRLRFGRHISPVAASADLMTFDSGRGAYVRIQRIEPEINAANETATMAVPRELILDGNGTAPRFGRTLDHFRAYAHNTNTGPLNLPNEDISIRDAMPDSGYGSIPFPVTQGLTDQGHALLESARPVRASNGEKGTLVFSVTASNLAEEEDIFQLTTIGVPSDWEVTLPGRNIRLEGAESRTFPVLVSTPFAHQHGRYERFTLEMTSQATPSSVGRLELGVNYVAVPQPSGHHDLVHIHSREEPSTAIVDSGTSGPFGSAYMNTLEADENDAGFPVRPTSQGFTVARSEFTWEIYLEPGLEMGLDFDLTRPGDISATFASEFDLYTATFSGVLVHQRPHVVGDRVMSFTDTILATIPPSPAKSIGQDTTFEAPLQPTPEADLVPHSHSAALKLVLNLSLEDSVQVFNAQSLDLVLTAGHFTLPLHEYRDPVASVFGGLAGVHLTHAGLLERHMNPGDQVLFNLTLTNDGAIDDTFTLRVNGTNAPWARILGETEIFVPTGSSRPLVVAVQAPTDAPHLDVADLIVTAASKAEPTIQGHLRVVAIVDTSLEHDDDRELVEALELELASPQEAPGATMLVTVLAVAALAAAKRRTG